MERTSSAGLKLSQPHPQLILVFPHPRSRLFKCPNLSSSRSRSSRPATRWDSNAEPSPGDDSYPGGDRDEKRRWWSDESPDAAVEAVPLGELIDRLWVIKVFKPFGWWLPFVIVPLLRTTGPDAFFLMVLGVSLGQAVLESIVFALEKLLGKPKRKGKTRKRPFYSRTASNKETEEEAEESSEAKTGTRGYQSWVATNIEKGGNENGVSSNFGGWSDLDDSGFLQPRSRPSVSRKKTVKKAKLSRKEKSSSTPLLLRLLIAVFPFLSSWTKML